MVRSFDQMILYMRWANKPHRWVKYDYSNSGYYYVTICTQNRIEWFGQVNDNIVNKNTIGEIAHEFWLQIPNHFKNVYLDEFIIMPNHVHGIIVIDDMTIVDAADLPHLPSEQYRSRRQFRSKMLLPKIIQQYKSSVTRQINNLFVHEKFAWQKSFHDHIIRTDHALNNIRQYIKMAPR